MRLCLDITSIGVPQERWTGVARMTWEFVNLYRGYPDLDLRFSAAGSLGAQEMVCQHLERIDLRERFAGRDHGLPVAAMLRWAASKNGAVGRLSGLGLRAVNYMRRPIEPTVLRELDAYFSFYAGIPRQLRARPSLRCGLYVHDLIPLLMPQYCSDKQRAVLRRILLSIRCEDLVVVNSECTRRDLAQHLRRDATDIQVVPLAANPAVFRRDTDAATLARVRQLYGLPDGPYFLSLHSAAPHKNMPLLIQAHAAYCQAVGRAALPMVIAGGKGNPRAEIATAGNLSVGELQCVTFLGFVADADLASLYSNARAFFFPSLYEGFGLPVLEALFCGVPVYISDRASLPEILAPLEGLHAGPDRLLEAERVEAWTDAFLRAETAAPLEADALSRLRTHFSWARAGAELQALLKRTA